MFSFLFPLSKGLPKAHKKYANSKLVPNIHMKAAYDGSLRASIVDN